MKNVDLVTDIIVFGTIVEKLAEEGKVEGRDIITEEEEVAMVNILEKMEASLSKEEIIELEKEAISEILGFLALLKTGILS